TDKLLPRGGTPRLPVVALQIFQQRNALFEPLQILGHSAVFASKAALRRKEAGFPGKDGGRRGFLNPQRPKTSEKWEYGVPAQGQRVMHEDLCSAMPNAYGQHRLAQKRKMAAEKNPDSGTIGARWRDRPRDRDL